MTECSLSDARTRLFNSLPYFELVNGWDRTRFADEIAKQDREFINRLKIELDPIISKSYAWADTLELIDKLAGSKLIVPHDSNHEGVDSPQGNVVSNNHAGNSKDVCECGHEFEMSSCLEDDDWHRAHCGRFKEKN